MESLSKKAKVVYAAFEMLNAKGLENKVNAYTILDFISENEDLQDHELIKDMENNKIKPPVSYMSNGDGPIDYQDVLLDKMKKMYIQKEIKK